MMCVCVRECVRRGWGLCECLEKARKLKGLDTRVHILIRKGMRVASISPRDEWAPLWRYMFQGCVAEKERSYFLHFVYLFPSRPSSVVCL